MPKHADIAAPDTEWRRLSRYLWVGAAQHGPIGTVERGRRFKAIDTSGTLIARCRELSEAQNLLEHLAEARRLAEDGDRRRAAA